MLQFKRKRRKQMEFKVIPGNSEIDFLHDTEKKKKTTVNHFQ